MEQVADAIRKVTATLQRRWDEGEVSAMIDLHDLVEVLLAIADEIDPPLPSRPEDITRGSPGHNRPTFASSGRSLVGREKRLPVPGFDATRANVDALTRESCVSSESCRQHLGAGNTLRLLTRELLVPLDDHIAIRRVEFHQQCLTARLLRGDQR